MRSTEGYFRLHEAHEGLIPQATAFSSMVFAFVWIFCCVCVWEREGEMEGLCLYMVVSVRSLSRYFKHQHQCHWNSPRRQLSAISSCECVYKHTGFSVYVSSAEGTFISQGFIFTKTNLFLFKVTLKLSSFILLLFKCFLCVGFIVQVGMHNTLVPYRLLIVFLIICLIFQFYIFIL